MLIRNRIIALLSVLPLVYVFALSIALAWWFTTFEPSQVTNARAVVFAFWTALVVHVVMMALMLALLVYFLTTLRGDPIPSGEKVAWAVALVAFNFLAYPFFYFFVIRPRLAAGHSS